jgi:cell wall-associated NlpC family hydrolase
LTTAGVAAADPSVSSKQAEAAQIMDQIQSLDAQVGAAVERWNLANLKLRRIEKDLKRTRFELGVARANLKQAQTGLARQAIQVYTSGSESSAIEVLFGATSLDDFLSRIDTVSRVSDQRVTLLGDVKRFRAQIGRQARQLEGAQAEQRDAVAQLSAERRSIESQLARRKSLLSSVRDEVAQLQAAERLRSLSIANTRPGVQPQQSSSGTLVGVSASTPEATVAPPGRYGGVIGIAMQYIGVPYVWGGASPSGFDCSGFVMYVFGRMGVSLPHSTYALWGVGVPVSRDQLAAGDLVFFNGLGHMGIYMGGGNFIHSPHTGDVVKVSSMSGWYASTYVGARRIL